MRCHKIQAIQIVSQKSKMGKTFLGEKIVEKLVEKGYKVCVLKHTHHPVDLDEKDSGRYRRRGADTIFLLGRELVVISKKIPSIEKIFSRLSRECNVVIIEGFLREKTNKVKVKCRVEVKEKEYVLQQHDMIESFPKEEIDSLIEKILFLTDNSLCHI